jgi:hypothetical protein
VQDQELKPATAARKLGVLLAATPDDFQQGVVLRSEYDALQADPPEWLATLRREGPHPKQEVARRLGISNSGLARGGVTDALTTAEIRTLLEQMPEWLVAERSSFAAVRADKAAAAAAAKQAQADADRG